MKTATASNETIASDAIEIRKLSTLRPNPLNPRGRIDPTDLDIRELAQSIREQNLLQPLLITPAGVIVAGHRRFVACKLAGLTEAPVLVRDLSEAEQLAAMLSENIQRQALTPTKAARACLELQKRGLSAETIAKQIGVGQSTVRNYLALASMPPALTEAFDTIGVPLGYIDLLAKLPDGDKVRFGLKAIRNNWLIAELKQSIAQTKGDAIAQTARKEVVSTVPVSTPQMSAARLVAILEEATHGLRRNEALISDKEVWGWIERFAGAVKAARGNR